jgi:hypothetical protein
MNKRKPRSLPALQTSLFCGRDRRAMTWDRIPEPARQRIVEQLAQLLRESCTTLHNGNSNGKDNRKDEGSND